MSELLAPLGAPAEQSAPVEAPPRAPALITEQQVLFATAAALPMQPAKTGRRWIAAVQGLGVSLRAALTTSSNGAGSQRRRYPSRNDFLEDSRMAREMMRL